MTEVLRLYHNMTEDDGEFKRNESTISNLTSLFDSNKPHPNENHSLTYVAPKAPKAGESCKTLKQSDSKASSNQKLKIITSKSVQVYKLENGNYVSQGTAGIAIVGNHELHLYQVILYKNNKDHLCKTHITPSFFVTVLENNYISFYDDSGQNWSILFSLTCNVQEFAKQVAIAKYNSQINQERIIVQDLSPLGRTKGKERDTVKVAYTCSILENDELVPWKEKETATVELTDVNAFPWHEGIRDWSECSKRIVIIPYKLSAPWTNDINKNTSIVMELELVCIISSCSDKPLTQKEKEKEKSDEGDRGMKTKRGGVMENRANEAHCKGKATSLKESAFISRSHKTDIISRIAKMGQDFSGSYPAVSGPIDSKGECSSMLRRGMNLNSVKNAVQQLHQSLPVHLGGLHQCSTKVDNSYCNNADDEIHNEEIPGFWEQKKMKSGMNVVDEEWEPCRDVEEKEPERNRCSEMNVVDGELRTSIHKLSEKVDEVLKKLRNLDYSKSDRFQARESGAVMDPMSVLTSIPGFIAEHENLKTEIELQRHAIDEQNKKIETLTDLTQRCVGKGSVTERKAIAEKKEKMNSEKQAENSKDWSEANFNINESACEAERYQREESSENQCVRHSCDVEKPEKKEGGVHDSERKLDHTVADKECQVSWNGGEKKKIFNDKTEDIGETYPSSKTPERISCEDSFEDIKRVMNAVNKKLQGYFEPDMNYSGSEVKEIIASTIKDVTVEYLRYKSKLRWSSGTEFSARDSSERRFEEQREQRTEGGQQEPGSPFYVRKTIDSADYSTERKSFDIRDMTSSRLPVNTSGKDMGSKLGVEKSGSRVSEIVSNRGTVSPKPSGSSRVSNITGVTRDDSYKGDTSEDGEKASDSAKNYSENSWRTHKLSFADGDPTFGNIRATDSLGKRSSPSSRRTLADAGEESVIGSSSRRMDNIGVTFSENPRISQQEIFVGSKSIECSGNNNIGDKSCEITISEREDTNRVLISPSPSQRFTSITEEQILEPDKVTRDDSFRLSGDGKVAEVDEEVLDIAESSKSIVSELARRDTVKTISQPSIVTTNNEESSLVEEMQGNGLIAQGVVRAESEIIGIVNGEGVKSGRNLKDEISEKVSEVGSRELPSLQSTSRVTSKGSRVDNTFGKYNSGVSVRRTSDVKGVENEEIEILGENSRVGESDDKKNTVLIQPLSDMSAVRDVTILSRTERDSAIAVEVAENVVESERQNGERNENARSESLESGNVNNLASEENSYDSGTEKAGSSAERIESDATEPGGATRERSAVSGLVRSVTEESNDGAVMENDVENDGISSWHNTLNPWEAIESHSFSSRSVVTGKESVMGVESREAEDGEIRRDVVEENDEDEGNEANEREEDGKIGSTEGKASDGGNEKDAMETGSLDDHDKESLSGQGNVNSSGANSVNGDCYFPDYYQNLVLSRPPPLPLEEDDDQDDDGIITIDNDEEWL